MTKAFQNTPKTIQAPLLLDFYKCFHKAAYKEGVSKVVINFTGRSGKHSNLTGNTHYMWAGLQAFINNIIEDVWAEFFEADKDLAVSAYKRVNEGGLGRPCDTSHIEALHDLGYLPLEFRALPEGVAVPYGVAAMTVESTHSDFYWLPNFIETILSDEIWPVQTSLTTASCYMDVVLQAVEKDGTPDFLVPFLCHDFSMRGMMGGTIQGGAALSGLGHLMSGFAGSDTLPAAIRAEQDYGAVLSLSQPFATIASVDATEHSVQCSFNNNDLEYFKHCMAKASPEGILSLVSDGYDFWKLVTDVLPQLKDQILSRNGKIVIRPDSGDPVEVLCGKNLRSFKNLEDYLDEVDSEMSYNCGQGYRCSGSHEDVVIIDGEARRVFCKVNVSSQKQDRGDRLYSVESVELLSNDACDLTVEQKGLVEVLWEMFGGTKTEKGYKLLDEHIGTIYGDSITPERQRQIYKRLHDKGFAVGNVVLGIGSYSYQYVTRDTHGSAVKATYMVIDGVETPIQKEVKGDAVKKSAKGLLVVKEEDGILSMHDNQSQEAFTSPDNLLQPVWINGEWLRIQDLDSVRANVKSNLDKLYIQSLDMRCIKKGDITA